MVTVVSLWILAQSVASMRFHGAPANIHGDAREAALVVNGRALSEEDSWFLAGAVGVAVGVVGLVVKQPTTALLGFLSGGGVPLGHAVWERVDRHRSILSRLQSRVAPGVEVDRRIERSGLISQFQNFLTRERLSQRFLVVTGQQSGGKTTGVKMAFENRTGVVYVTVAEKDKYFSDVLAAELGLDKSLGPVQIARRIRAFYTKRRRDPFIVVADVSSKTPDKTVEAVGNEMKVLVEEGAGNIGGIILLSNFSSVFALKNNENRKKHMTVDGLSDYEANFYFDKRKVLDDDDGRLLRQRIIKRDTTIIGTLEEYADTYLFADDAATGRAAVETMFDLRAAEADTNLEELLKFGRGVEKGAEFHVSEMRKLTRRLHNAKQPEDGVLKKGLVLPSAADVAPVLRKYPVLRYNPATRRYYWYDPRHRVAADRYFGNRSSK